MSVESVETSTKHGGVAIAGQLSTRWTSLTLQLLCAQVETQELISHGRYCEKDLEIRVVNLKWTFSSMEGVSFLIIIS